MQLRLYMKNEHVSFYREHFENIQTMMIVIAVNYFHGNTTAADKAVVKALKKLEKAINTVASITDDRKRNGYIKKIIINCCKDVFELRKRLPIVNTISRIHTKEEYIDGIYKDDEKSTEPTTENAYGIDLRDDLELAKLNKIQIQVINLILDGYLLREIAPIIGKSLGATKMSKNRAIILLKKYYGV